MSPTALPIVALAKDLRRAIRAGHPWLYDRALVPGAPALEPGELALLSYRKERVAWGFADPRGAIAFRVLGLGDRPPEAKWIEARARRAASCRMGNPRLAETNAFRVIHGENDFMPGLVVDLYADTAVMLFDGVAAAAFWLARVAAVVDGLRSSGLPMARVWTRTPRGQSRATDGPLVGDEPPQVIEIFEFDARFEVDVRRGQKTGLFLDQRDNRRLVGRMASAARVLNLFSYTGGFSVHAALGGARQVTSVDIAEPATAAAIRNFARNELADGNHRFLSEDAFAFLEGANRRGDRYDLVIVDPPSFAPNERSKARGLRSYRRLNRLALAVVQPGGTLISASCSSHVTTADLLAVLGWAERESGRRIRVLDIRGAASDHPVLPGFPEGRYLDLLVVYVE